MDTSGNRKDVEGIQGKAQEDFLLQTWKEVLIWILAFLLSAYGQSFLL